MPMPMINCMWVGSSFVMASSRRGPVTIGRPPAPSGGIDAVSSVSSVSASVDSTVAPLELTPFVEASAEASVDAPLADNWSTGDPFSEAPLPFATVEALFALAASKAACTTASSRYVPFAPGP